MYRTTVILPAPATQWEVWQCARRGGSVWHGSAEDLVKGRNGSSSVVVALPARSCRTFSFEAPTRDRELLRKLAFAQLEKRGLTSAGVDQTPFACHVLAQDEGKSLVSVDVVTPAATATLEEAQARALIAHARLFPLPAGKLVVIQEQGRLVLCASRDGRLLHTQIVSATGDLNGHAAAEIRIVSLALQQQGVLEEVTGLEVWGDFSAGDMRALSDQLGLPVEAKRRPAPDSLALEREASTQLLGVAARTNVRRRRLGLLRWAVAAVVILPLLSWVYAQHRKLTKLETEAARMETVLNVPGAGSGSGADQEQIRAENALVTAAQARWTALRMALEPRRYPVAQLDGFSRCLGAGDVVLTRFESKLADITASGTARSAMDAYQYFNAINKDTGLGVYAWSMLQPTIGADGSATFEIKGKMR